EVDLAVVADDDGRALKIAVGPVAPLPLREGRLGDALPAKADNRRAGVLVVLDAHGARPAGDGVGRGVLPRDAVLPVIDDQRVADPYAHAVVGKRAEAVHARFKRDAARPPGGQAVGRMRLTGAS